MKRITTEAQWLAGNDPARLVQAAGGLPNRKYRLMMTAFCRLMWDDLPDPRSRLVVELAEQLADGWSRPVRERLRAAAGPAMAVYNELLAAAGGRGSPAHRLSYEVAMRLALGASCRQQAENAVGMFLDDYPRMLERELHRRASEVIRCVAGTPFRPAAAVAPAWQTPTVLAVARGIYDGRTFHDLPVLADALQDAGCEDEHVLGHCRDGGVHARGCWVVDALLGRA